MLTPHEAIWIEAYNQVHKGLGRTTMGLSQEQKDLLCREAADLVARRVKELKD